ncbi:MAG: hypothetical protein Q9227_008551 [Pyrenula ochraceoflavens]
MSVNDLPLELILRIYDFLTPASHLNFAVINKKIAAYSRPVLDHHRRCCEKGSDSYIVSWSDYHRFLVRGKYGAIFLKQKPILDLLKRISNDSIASWHLRNLDLRKAKPFDGTSHSSSEAALEMLCKSIYARIYYAPFAIFDLRRSREAQEIALLALCSRVNALQVSHLRLEEGSTSSSGIENDDDDNFNYRTYLGDMILHIRNLPSSVWPPWFLSLRKVTVGRPLHERIDRDMESLSPIGVLPIFLLPGIETISLRGLTYDPYEGNDLDDAHNWRLRGFSLPTGSSSVKHLLLADVHNDCLRTVISPIIQAAKSLESMCFRDCEFHDFNIAANELAKYQGESLQTFVFGGDYDALRGYRCSRFFPEELEGGAGLKKIKILTLETSDIRLNSMSCCSPNGENDGLSGNMTESHNVFVEYMDQSAIPECVKENVEILILQQDRYDLLNRNDVRAIDHGLCKLLQDGQCPNLKALYLDKNKPNVHSIELDEAHFARTMECGKQRGLEVHVQAGSTDHYISEICDNISSIVPSPKAQRRDHSMQW